MFKIFRAIINSDKIKEDELVLLDCSREGRPGVSDLNELFRERVSDKFKAIVVAYDLLKETYEYRGFSCQKESVDEMIDILIDNILFYSYDESELSKKGFLLDDFKRAVKCAITTRLPERLNAKTDGLAGELLLDVMIKIYEKESKLLIARPRYTEPGYKNEIKGYDALFFAQKDNMIKLYLGQVKSGGKSYCKNGINSDLKEKYQEEYWCKNLLYVADRCDSSKLNDLLLRINKIEFEADSFSEKKEKIAELLKKNNVQIIIPCLMVYSSDIYNDSERLKESIKHEVDSIKTYFDDREFPIDVGVDFEIMFWVFPVESIDYIRNKIFVYKTEVYND